MKMKLQGSDARSIKTLQSQNSPQRRIRFWLSRLATLHGRLFKDALCGRWPSVIFRLGQPAISANENSSAGYEKSKSHCLYLKWKHAVGALVQITFLNRHRSSLTFLLGAYARSEKRSVQYFTFPSRFKKSCIASFQVAACAHASMESVGRKNGPAKPPGC